MNPDHIERRIVPLDIRQITEADRRIEGYATTFGTSYNLFWFHEVIQKGAFARTLQDDQHVLLNAHDLGQVFGNTRNDTFHLEEDDHGLRIVASLPDTQAGRDMYEMVRKQYIDGMSIGFAIEEEEWEFPPGGLPIRIIYLIKLYEASLTAFPANPQTSVNTQVARQRMMRAQHRLASPVSDYLALQSDLVFMCRHRPQFALDVPLQYDQSVGGVSDVGSS